MLTICSDITDALNVSGSLSIKYGAIGGSGKGQFIDSDKFRDSDLNFFIQVSEMRHIVLPVGQDPMDIDTIWTYEPF